MPSIREAILAALHVRLQLLPLTTALMVATRSDSAVQSLDADASNDTRAAVFAAALARRAIVDWGGVGHADGTVITVSPEGIDALLSLWPIFEAFNLHYVSPGMLLDAEKKRLCALADWHFSGGDNYCRACQACEACESACPDCPARLNQPLSRDGWRSGIWSPVLAAGCVWPERPCSAGTWARL